MKNALLFIVHFVLISMLSIIPILIIRGAFVIDPYRSTLILVFVFLGIAALLSFITIIALWFGKDKTKALQEKRYAEYWANK